MSIQQTNIIDFLSIEESSQTVVLTISDHLPWNDINEHLFILQEKINTYIRFIESGEILESYPSAKDRAVQFSVVFKYSPPVESQVFLLRVSEVLSGISITLVYKTLGSDKLN